MPRIAPLNPYDLAIMEGRSLARLVASAAAKRTGNRSLIREVDAALFGPGRNEFVRELLRRAGGRP